jgi:hypothetical protein
MERNPFLAEAWENKARNERGQENNTDAPEGYERDVRIYRMLERVVSNTLKYIDKEKAENIRSYYDIVMDSVIKYNNAILNYNSVKISDNWSQEDMENADLSRRRIHNGLISNLDILARLMNSAGLDISWRNAIGIDRKEVQRWAQNVMYHQQKQKEGL